MRTTTVIALVLVASCRDKEPVKTAEPAQKPATGSGSDTSPTPAPAGSGTAAPAAADERCASPCRFLATVALADIAAEVKKTCGTEWKPAAADDCDQPDYLRNCIYAGAGYPFKKRQWQQAFGAEPWYKPRADFKDADLGKVAQGNVAALKQQAKDCRLAQAVKPEDLKIVEKWLDTVRAGKPELPAVTMIGDKVDPKVLAQQLVDTKDHFKKGLKTEYHYTQEEWGGAFKGQTVRTIEFSPGNAEPPKADCQDEEGCDLGDVVLLGIDDKGKIVGVQQILVACPRVYLGGVYQGEILRNLARPGLERWQGLAVTLPCAATATFRVAEELPEVTELDALELIVDGERIAPLACEGPICGNDGVAQTLGRGESLEVTFALPASARCRRATLRANGHYVPVSAATASTR